MQERLQKFSTMKVILMGYCLIVLIGTFLLMLPAATNQARGTPLIDAFFTATSAACVTGLVPYDTFTHWSLFGQLTILVLIQIGGIGFMTIAISIIALTKHKIGLSSRVLMQESVAAPQVGGIVRMTKMIFTGTVICEGIGAFLLSFFFCPKLGLWKGIYFSVFHAVSAFCNAGFDLMGIIEPTSSLTSLGANWYVDSIIMALIFVGGIGFFVWSDLINHRFHFSKLRLHTKLVLTVSPLLIILGAAGIFILEQGGNLYPGMPVHEQILASFFQSVSSRTAGFNSVDLARLSESSQFLIMCLMMIGGSTGSTAGGIKTTTFAILIMSIFTTFRRKKSIECFGRRLDDEALRRASCVFMIYLLLSMFAGMIISEVEGIPLLAALFESISAIGTVGLSLGITPGLGILSKILLAMLMLLGRVGSITILLAFSSDRNIAASKLPHEKVQVG